MRIILFLMCAVLSVPFALAIPLPPAEYWEAVYVAGSPAPDGMLVQAVVNGQALGSTYTTGGYYKLQVPADDLETAADEGAVAGDDVLLMLDSRQVKVFSGASGVHREAIGAASGSQQPAGSVSGSSASGSRSSGSSSSRSSRSPIVDREAAIVVGQSAQSASMPPREQERIAVQLPPQVQQAEGPSLLTIIAVANGILIGLIAAVAVLYLAVTRR